MIELKDAKADPLMVELFNKLPPIGSTWPLDERMLWLTACEAALNLIYGPVDRVDLRWPIVWSRQESGESSSVIEPAEPPAAPKRAAPETLSTAAGAALLQGDIERLKDLVPNTPAIEQLDERARTLSPAPHQRPGPKPKDVESTPRPEGIPTTFGMIRDVLEEKPGLTAREVAAEMAKRWWPGLQFKTIGPDISTAVSKGRINRDADGALTLTDRGRNLVSTDARIANVGTFPKKAEEAIRKGAAAKGIDPAAAVAIAKIESKPPPPPKPAPAATIKFEHSGRTTMLSTAREYSIAGKLKAAMGKGHVAEGFLAETVIGSNTENNRLVVRDICRNLCGPLADVGLTIEHYPGFGLLMKEVS